MINLYQTEEKATSQKMLMQVIRTCADVPDNLLKKHLLLYYEITGLGTDKCDPERRSMFILVWYVISNFEFFFICLSNICNFNVILIIFFFFFLYFQFSNSLMKNLDSGNEYIIGATLRFLSKVTDEEFLKQLFPSIIAKVQHSHPYVRRYAVQCFQSMYEHHPDMIPNAPEILYQLLMIEKDVLTQRNCLAMLFSCEEGFDYALSYLSQNEKELTRLHPSIQLLISQMIRRQIQQKQKEGGKWVNYLLRLINSTSPAVRYESARGLMLASSSPKIVHLVVDCFVKIYSTVV